MTQILNSSEINQGFFGSRNFGAKFLKPLRTLNQVVLLSSLSFFCDTCVTLVGTDCHFGRAYLSASLSLWLRFHPISSD